MNLNLPVEANAFVKSLVAQGRYESEEAAVIEGIRLLKGREVSVCRKAPRFGDDRSDLGEGIRSTYVGRYIIYFREKDGTLEIVRVVPGDLEVPFF